MTALTDLATKIATDAHQGQTRWDKKTPYISHPAAIARALIQQGYGEDYVVVAWLHDVLEDTDVTDEQLLDVGIPERLVDSVRTISKKDNQKYLDYILDVQADEIARVVKIADITHNLSDLRAGSMRQKYELAIHILEN
tara:strand:+ start:353 stop:769 length:417 start_codon:yes stop_codon:yes gene_type:complete